MKSDHEFDRTFLLGSVVYEQEKVDI